MKNNVIEFPGFQTRFNNLKNEPTFENFLSCFHESLHNISYENDCIQWWENSKHNVLTANPLVEFCEFLDKVSFFDNESEPETKQEEECFVNLEGEEVKITSELLAGAINVITEQVFEVKDPYTGEIISVDRNAYLAEHYPAYKAYSPSIELLRNGYGLVFKNCDPLADIAETFMNFFLEDKSSDKGNKQSENKLYSGHKKIKYQSNSGYFVRDILGWIIGKDKCSLEYETVIKYIISDSYEDYPNPDIVEAATKSPSCVFRLFINYFCFEFPSVVAPILKIPFKHNLSLIDQAGLNSTNVDFMSNISYGSLVVSDDDPFIDPFICKDEFIDSMKIFFANFSEYRRQYFKGRYYYDDLLAIFFKITSFYPDSFYIDKLYECGADLPFLIPVYINHYEYKNTAWSFNDLDLVDNEYSNFHPLEALKKDIGAVIAMTRAICDQGLNETASNFLAISFFNIVVKLSTHFEIPGELIEITREIQQLSFESKSLEIAIDFAIDKAKQNDHKINVKKLFQLKPDKDRKLHILLQKGESEGQEFKETLRKNLKADKNDPEISKAVLKSICAFINCKGGILFVGVDDNGEPKGLEADGFPNNDKFELHFTNLLDHFSRPIGDLIRCRFEKIWNKDVFVVECRASKTPVFLDGNFYYREGPQSKSLDAERAWKYINMHFIN
jgi:hypothetical protein